MSRYTLQKNISRLMAVLLCLVMVLSMAPAARAAESGSCGNNLTWTLVDGTLTLEGSGAMNDYTEENPAPWYPYREQIMNLSLSGEITRIGTWAFADCANLASVSIPGNVEVIGESAFRRCTGMTMLTLGEGIRTIGVCAFEACSALADLRLPNTLININDHAFYMCSALTYVTIPGAVRNIGSGVFAYCSSLIRADIDAAVTMPSWSFYGCDNLQTVTVNGTSVAPESLMVTTPPQGIPGYVPDPDDSVAYEEPEAATTPVPTEPGSTKVEKTENSTIVDVKTPDNKGGSVTSEITSTVQNDNGWQEVINKVNTSTRGNEETVDVTVYAPNSDSISADVLNELAGKDVNLTVQTQSGSQFTLDCTQLDGKVKDDLVLSYTISLAEDVPEALASCVVYRLKFHESASVVTEMIIRLPGEHTFQTASLYQQKGRKDPELLQSVLVDGSNNAHWYLRNVDKKMDYMIGIDVPGAVADSPIIPAELAGVYKVENVYDGVEYVVTGRTSSWNMGLGKVMGILAAVMIGVIVVVGVVMFLWNKKHAASIYDENWDDDE